jgi:hypothetical protein
MAAGNELVWLKPIVNPIIRHGRAVLFAQFGNEKRFFVMAIT